MQNQQNSVLWMRMPTTMHDEGTINLDIGHVSVLRRLACGYASALQFLYPRFTASIEAVLGLVVDHFLRGRKLAFEFEEAAFESKP